VEEECARRGCGGWGAGAGRRLSPPVADRAGSIAGAGNWWARPRSTTLGAAAP